MLRNGCVQEEIRFLICPELIVSRVLTEPLRDNEALLLSGFERFASYTGYSYSFAFAAPCVDEAVSRVSHATYLRPAHRPPSQHCVRKGCATERH